MDDQPIVFADWEAVLKAQVPPDRQRRYREAIVKFLYWLRKKGKIPVLDTFKEHLVWKKSYLPPDRFEIRREALRWYYKTGQKRMKRVDASSATVRTESAPPLTNAVRTEPDPPQARQPW